MNNTLPKSFEWVTRLKKYDGNPIIRPHGKWAADMIFNPAAVVRDNKVWLLCRCINLADKRRDKNWSISSLVWAKSDDGIHFTLDDEPFLYPDDNCKYTGGYEDPRIVYIPDEKLYLLTYTGISFEADGTLNAPCLLATSNDLVNWTFHGETFPERAVCIIDRKINDKYWGYYGNSNKYITYSDDLITWHCDGDILMKPRPNMFDSFLCEGACSPLVSDEGILFIYNGATFAEQTMEYSQQTFGMTTYANANMYATGWALIDRNDPTKLIARCDEPFLAPSECFECYGLVGFTIFSGGHVELNGKHFLYYGACDTRIGVAIAD